MIRDPAGALKGTVPGALTSPGCPRTIEPPAGERAMDTARRLSVYVVEDSRTQADIARALLEKAGHHVVTCPSSVEALRDIPCRRPDCVLIDIMLPEVDGYEVCRRLRAIPELAPTKLAMVSVKAYPFERRRALEMGADGYFVKPLHPATFVAELERLVAGTLLMTFWGVRGTLPISRKDSMRYGGSTSCVSLDFPDGRLVVFDAGTGIKALSDALTATGRTRLEGRLFISHPHWDHIQALPFFAPFYRQGNQFDVCGPSHGHTTMRDLIAAQMDGVYFPITVREFAASVIYRDLGQGEYEIGGHPVRTMLLTHPGNCLGYRLQHDRRAVCYVTDNELFWPDSPFYSEEYVERLADFTRGADVLITDCAYTDEDYPRRVGYGHSSVSRVADLAARARVRELYLFHHDPDHTDAVIDAKLARVQALLAERGATTTARAPSEGAEFEV
jgi:phosphoribosyl 1,2-cyclic phosphodiesterase/ActR/RegA family two-component response regulator